MKKLVILFLMLIFIGIGSGATLEVGSGKTYSAIQACANVAQPGDICLVGAGTYSAPSLPRDGSSGNWIIFKTVEGESSQVTGSWDLSGRDYIEINGFTTGSFSGSSIANIKIINNLIQNVHDAIELSSANDILLSDNTFNNVSGDVIRQFGERWTIRDNIIIDEDPLDKPGDHFDFWQSWCHVTTNTVGAYSLIENNTVIDIRGPNAHFALSNTGCDLPTKYLIIRYNKVHNIGSLGVYIDANPYKPGQINNVIYNNDFSYLKGGKDWLNWQTHAHTMTSSVNSSGINNLYVNAMNPLNTIGVSGTTDWHQSHNLYYDDNGIDMTFKEPALSEIGAIKNQNPLLTNPSGNNFSLQPSSPAINKGAPLTKVAVADSGTGTSLVVEKAEFFQPGWGGVDADWIAVGTVDNVVQISSIDYENNIITLKNSITRNDGDSVWLYKDSSGNRVLYGDAPDIGAVEYVSPQTPICGNSILETGEQCDDGNLVNGDGCSSICQTESSGEYHRADKNKDCDINYTEVEMFIYDDWLGLMDVRVKDVIDVIRIWNYGGSYVGCVVQVSAQSFVEKEEVEEVEEEIAKEKFPIVPGVSGDEVVWLRLDGDFSDSSGNGNDATCIKNCPTSTSGKIGTAYDFDGINDALEISGINLYDLCVNGCTFSAYINPRVGVVSSGGSVIAHRDYGDDLFQLYYNQYRQYYFNIGQDGSPSQCSAGENNYGLTYNEWHLLTGVYNTTHSTIYLDGGKINSNECGFVGGLVQSSWDNDNDFIVIGARHTDLAYYMNGTIDDVRIYNRALSQTEIQALM